MSVFQYRQQGGGGVQPAGDDDSGKLEKGDKKSKRLLEQAKSKIQKYIISGIINDEFIPAFFSSVQKVPADIGIGLAAVTLTENGIRLIYDIEFMANATKEDIDYTLSHELMHVLNYHFTRGSDMMAEYAIGVHEFYKKYAPLADLPVNHALSSSPGYKKLGSKLLTYGSTGGVLSYESHPTFESIVRWLRSHPKSEEGLMSKLGIGGEGGPTVVQVDENGNVTVISKGGKTVVVVPQVTEEGKREYMRDVAELVKSANRSAGSTPYELQRAIRSFLDEYEDSVLRGWALLEQLLVGERSINKSSERCYGRMNRRTRIIPGKRRIKGFSAMMIVDESGSMSDAEVNLAFTFAKKIVLRENNDRLYLVHWDTAPTQEVEELKFESDVEELERKRCGGTDFDEFFTHEVFQRHDYDLYICITDGYPGSWPKAECDKPVVWIITQEGGYQAWESQYNKGLAVCVYGESYNDDDD